MEFVDTINTPDISQTQSEGDLLLLSIRPNASEYERLGANELPCAYLLYFEMRTSV